MMRRKFLENRAGALGIIAILLAILLAGSEVACFSIGTGGYRLDLDSDCLPEELIDLMLEDGCSFETIEHPSDILWETEGYTKFTEVNRVTGQLFETKLTFPENDYTRSPVYIYEYIVTARNRINWPLFSLHVRGTFIDTGLVRPPPSYFDKVISYADSHVSFPFRIIWRINSLDKDQDNFTGKIYTEGQFFDRFTRETVNIWACISYKKTGGYIDSSGGIRV